MPTKKLRKPKLRKSKLRKTKHKLKKYVGGKMKQPNLFLNIPPEANIDIAISKEIQELNKEYTSRLAEYKKINKSGPFSGLENVKWKEDLIDKWGEAEAIAEKINILLTNNLLKSNMK